MFNVKKDISIVFWIKIFDLMDTYKNTFFFFFFGLNHEVVLDGPQLWVAPLSLNHNPD
ncbi:hypothetical protein ACE6H2_016876 [Prunus campanulata]